MTIELIPAQTLQQLLCSEMNRFSRRSLLSFIRLRGSLYFPLALPLAPSLSGRRALRRCASPSSGAAAVAGGGAAALFFKESLGGRPAYAETSVAVSE